MSLALLRNVIIQILLLSSRLVWGFYEEEHILHCDLTVLSPKQSEQPQSMVMLYFNNKPFQHDCGDRKREKSQRHWIKGQDGAEIWATQTKDMQEKEEQLRRMLAKIMTQKDHSGGIHTLQETFGCEIQGNDTRSFWRLGYDGQNLLHLDQKTLTWKASVPSAHTIKTIWESHGPTLDEVKAFLYHLCPDHLQRCLTYSRGQMMDKGPPKLKVTRRRYPVGRTTLTCKVFNLYSPVATLTWLQDGKPTQQQTFGPGTILPSGDGTYQTWLSIWILPSQESEFTCSLRNHNKNIEVPDFYGHQDKTISGTTSSASALVASVLCTLLLLLACSF
ncbi:MHC class I-like protein MILL2 isoform X2 [Alexandromys fortis]|uniref:MHC class I-like protein MILL2 isoform X2 n=1 Tax=Alexandromys fortis TaxID=100897 RepID=UPI002152E3CA|nr:MHC class I-like protein MILL2 isoform X2 [Microtus fortis]XP_049983120.1 MHC class I-like protein MILL2 isoform X2 [Microtus fortis]